MRAYTKIIANPLILWIAIALVLILPLSPVFSEEEDLQPKAIIKLEKKEISVGDPIKVEIVVEAPAGTTIHWPDLMVLLPEFPVSQIELKRESTEKGIDREQCSFYITAYKVGRLDFPALPIRFEWKESAGVVETDPEQITVESVLKGEDEKLADIKGPVKIPFDVWPLVKWILFFLIIILAGAVLFFWIRKRRAKEKIIPAEDIFKGIPPHEWAYSKLDQLLGQRLLEKGHYKEFYVAFSEILKHYLEGRYRVETMERTTQEILDSLMRAQIQHSLCREVLAILEECDYVKFAKYKPAHEQSKESIQKIYEFIDKTKPIKEVRGEEEKVLRS